MNRKNLLFIFQATLFWSVAFSYSQQNSVRMLQKLIEQNNYEQATTVSKLINPKKLSPLDLARYNYLKANIHLSMNQDDLAFNHLIQAKTQFKAFDSLKTVSKINLEIVTVLLAVSNNKIDYKPYLDEYLDYVKNQNEPSQLAKAYMQIGKSFYDTNPASALTYFKKAAQENQKTTDEVFKARIYQNMGATYAHQKINKIDSALIVYDKALTIYKKKKLPVFVFNIYTNKGKAYWKKKQYDKAITFYKLADSIPLTEYKNKNKEILYGFMAETYKSKGDYKKALEYLDKQKVYQDILNENQRETAIKDIDVKYNTEATKLKNQRLQKIIYSVLGLSFIIILIGSLAYKNATKKKKIAEQEKLIQTQKLETTLKEQELHEIDVMLESQEKERQQIANELHDNLGSLLATLKFNFQSIKHNTPSNIDSNNLIYEKTDALLEEAYQEVRNISHLKNLGVIGNQGLEAAVKKMAEKMSVIEKIKFNVFPFGMTERLENSKEIILFRMIQELCTNIIKHSEASEVNIYLTQHNKSEINIIIEDNGKGFNPKKTTSKDGIGLHSIEKKVEQMGGTFTIDSVINNGTTIIIDLAL